MKSVWQALIWKEWHEHKWKLAALTVILISLPALTLLSDHPNNIFGAVSAMLWLAVPVLSIFIVARAAAGENSERTMPFLQSMPTPMRRAALVKLAFAILTVCISVACVIAFAGAVTIVGMKLNPTFERGIVEDRIFFNLGTNWFLSRFLLGSVAGTSLVIWVAAVGVNRSDEVRAGALGILAIVSYSFLLVVWAWKFIDFSLPFSGFPAWFKTLAAIGPCGPVVLMWMENPEDPSIPTLASSWPFLLASMAFHTLLAACFVANFGRVANVLRPSERTATVVIGEWLAPPRRTKFGALVWKQFRESGPLALIAMCTSFAMWIIFALYAVYDAGERWNQFRDWRVRLAEDWFQSTIALWMFLGFFVAIVAGIGVFFEELRPGMNNFWRSRPINRDLWFWTKFSFGIGITLLAILIPVLIALPIVAGQDVDVFAPDRDLAGGILVFAIQATVFATAALAMILVRQAIYAAVLAIAIAPGFAVLAEYYEWSVLEMAICFAVNALLATFLAWLAVRYDWSLRR
ncbi:MAG: hypothetical protein WD851_10645 [Pirellulales bacterium]